MNWTTVARVVGGAAGVSGAEAGERLLHVREAISARRRALLDVVDQRGASDFTALSNEYASLDTWVRSFAF